MSKFESSGPTPPSPQELTMRAYEARFDYPTFDKWKMPRENIGLMRMALARGTPVTEEDLRQRWAELGFDPDNFDIPPDVLT